MKKKIVSLLLLGFMFLPFGIPNEKEEPTEVQTVIIEPVEVTEEKEFFFDLPLSEDLQRYIFSECEKADICPELVIAIIERESDYNADTIGDNGESLGLMQIYAKWHTERMERLGIADLSDPYQNITVGIDYLAELFHEKADVYWVLMAYNGGRAYATEHWEEGNYSDYALEVSERSMELEREREWYQCFMNVTSAMRG